MKATGTIGTILKAKPDQIWSVTPETTVFEAILQMAEKDIGALLVMKDDKLVGVFSERDYARNVIVKGKASKRTLVKEIIASDFTTATPSSTVEECMLLMTKKRVRHLPILESKKVVGIVSIGDLVNYIITAQDVTIHQLENYISGQYPS